MAQTVELFDPAALIDAIELEACARRAALAAMKYRGVWQAMARAMARKPKLRLEFHPRFSATDGDTIYLQVPIALGMDIKHDNSLCGLRDELLVQRCEACAAHEEVFITIIHEVAHLVHGTFHPMSERQKHDAVTRGLNLECKGKPDGSRAAKIRKTLESAPERIQQDYLSTASIISPFLPLVINALEDSRVNLATEKTRKGTRTMFAASHAKIMQRGIQVKDDQYRFLNQAPVNMQALTAVFFMSSGIPWERWLDPEVAQRLDDVKLKDLCKQGQKVRSISDVYALAVPVLERLRELGFCLSPEDEEDDPRNDDDGEQGEDQDGESGEGDPSDDGTESSDTGQDSSGSSSSGASGSNPSSDPNEPETDDKVNDLDGDSAEEDDGDSDGDDSDGEGDDGEGNGDDSEADEADSGEGSGAGNDAEDGVGDSDPQPSTESQGGSDNNTDAADSQPQDNSSSNSGRTPGQPEPSSNNQDGEGGPGSSGDYVAPGDYYSQDQYEQDGTAEDVEQMMESITGHDKFGDTEEEAAQKDHGGYRNPTPEEQVFEALDKALNQVLHFDHFSNELAGLNLWHHGDPVGDRMAWSRNYAQETEPTPESILSPALMRLRLAFTDNRRAGKKTGLKKGRVNSKALARVSTGEDRVFQKRLIPTKKDYFVVVGFDISGSTQGRKINLIKGAVRAQAELLVRLGVKFAIYAHSSGGDHVDIFEVKAPQEAWGPEQLGRLDGIESFGYNLDGHSLEFYRKVAQRRQETDKVVLFYTDGALNDIGEEYDVFTENVKIMRQKHMTCVGVEVGTNSGMSERLGMDTVRIDGSEDIHKVVAALEKYIG